MQSLDIALKGIKAVFIYNMLREGVPNSNSTWEKRIQVVVTSGVRDKVRQGMLLSSNYVYMNEIFICWYRLPTRPFTILYIMHSFASFLRSDRDLHPNVWSILVTLEVLWWRCKTSLPLKAYSGQ